MGTLPKLSRYLLVLLLICFILFLLLKKSENKASKFISNVKSRNKITIDSLQQSMDIEDSLYFNLEKAIIKEDFSYADSILNILITQNKGHIVHIFKGMMYEKKQKYTEAIKEYTLAIQEIPYSIGLEKRGNVYLRQSRLDLALIDFRSGYLYNYDYSLQIAKTFELLQEKDSAKKYYSIYLKHYPLNDTIKQKIELLK